ncbi:hypothetical protein ACI76Y_02655 [Capnocytophaga cynodegmi]|uniref:hypothetical protein n=1 Tax=Capnocytophaga cynodegmi TaxID=28189 RepID=UPI00385CD5B8
MKKIYKEKYTHLWENGTWVVCPNCQKNAIIHHTGETFPNHSVLKCNHCGLVKKSGDLSLFNLIVKLNCPFCGNNIELTYQDVKEKQSLINIKCRKCDNLLSVKPRYQPNYSTLYTDKVNGLMCDNTFGLPYFFQENVRGNLFWAKNDKHLLEMENYISSDLRPRKGMTMVAKLPTFVKIKKNKEIVLKILEKWKKSYK